MPIWLLVAIPVLGVSLALVLKKWISEYLFYKRNNWNLNADNPQGLSMYWGEGTPQTPENRMSNEARMYFGYPFFVFVISVLLVGFCFAAYAIETCMAPDLKDCGIELHDGSITIQ